MRKNTKQNTKINRLHMLAWLILPMLTVWVSVNYLIGSINKPRWATQLANSGHMIEEVVLADTTETEPWKWDGQGKVTLWFDDAWKSQYQVAYPILESKGMKAALAIPTDNIGYDAYMNWAQVKRLQFAGWELTSHSRTHDCEVQHFSPEEVEEQIVGSKKILQERGIVADIYVAPCGRNNELTTDIIKKNYLAARNVEPGINPLPLEGYYDLKVIAIEQDTTIELVKSALAEAKLNKSWLIFMFHEVDENAQEYGTDKEKFLQVINEVEKSKLEVVLPSQVINYVP